MRKRPEQNKSAEKFIDNAIIEKINQPCSRKNTPKFRQWPIEKAVIEPVMEEGSNLGKPLNISIKEYEWNTIDKHIKIIGVPKAVWIKHAMFKLLEEEQKYYSRVEDKD